MLAENMAGTDPDVLALMLGASPDLRRFHERRSTPASSNASAVREHTAHGTSLPTPDSLFGDGASAKDQCRGSLSDSAVSQTFSRCAERVECRTPIERDQFSGCGNTPETLIVRLIARRWVRIRPTLTDAYAAKQALDAERKTNRKIRSDAGDRAPHLACQTDSGEPRRGCFDDSQAHDTVTD